MSQEVKVVVKLDNDQFKKKMQETTNSMSQSESKLSGSLKKIGTAVAGAFAVSKIVDFGASVVKMGIQYNATLEQSTVAWTTLLGTQEDAKKMINDISNYATKTPFSKMGVDEMAKQLHNAGFAGEDLFAQLTKFGDMGSAFNIQEDSLKEMVRQYSQVQMAGTAYTEDLNILQDRGIPIFKALAETMGIATEDVKKYASEGKITAEVYNAALDSIASTTSGAMEAQSKTFSGILGTLQDGLSNIAGILTADLFEALKAILEPIAGLVEAFVSVYNETGSLTEAFGVIGESMGGVSTIFEALGTIFNEIWLVIIQPLFMSFSDLLIALWELFQEVSPQIQEYFSVIGDVFNTVWEGALKPVFTMFVDWVDKLFKVFQECFPIIQQIFTDAVSFIKQAWENILKPVFEIIKQVLEYVVLPAFKGVFEQGVVPLIKDTFSSIGKLWNNSLKPIFQGILDFITGVFTGNWSKAWDSVVSVFKGIWEGIKTVAKAPINAVINMINGLISGINNIKVPDWVPGIGGASANIPKIPQLWKGSNFTIGGPTLVGEQGPELVNMPRGASVLPAHKTRSVLEGANVGGVNQKITQTANIYVELDGRTIARVTGAEIVDMVRLKTGLSL